MPTKVALSQMVDLALGTPEVGAVNFNVLHTLLHAMLKRLNILDTTAEINEFDRDFLASSKQRSISGLSDLDSGKGDDSEDGMSERSVPPAKRSPYHQLEIKVAKLTEQMDQLNALPSNLDLFERSTKTEGEQRPVTDMWQYMQLKKRVDNNEEGIGKLMSLVEDMMKQMQDLKNANKDLMDKVKNLNLDDLMKRLKSLEERMNEMNDRFSQLPTPEELAQFVTWPGLEDALRGIRTDFEGMAQPPERVVIEMSSQTEPQSRPTSSRPGTRMSSSPGPSAELLDILERLGKLTDDHETLKKRVDELEEELKNKLDKSALENLNISGDFLDQLAQLKEDLKELQDAREKDSDALSRAQQAILQLQAEVEKLHNTTKDIIEENNNRNKQIDDLFQYCDKLQEIKADKEYVQMEVDVKADKRSLDNKVNHTLFDSTTNEINNMIKEILDKLSGYEDNMKTSYNKLNEDLDGKLDRLELDPLKEWLESKLKALNDKLKRHQIQSVEWTEDDAAGIRKQLIQRFHCISCDRPVDLVPTGPVPSLPTNTGLPPTRSPRPYTTFELDQIRQHAKSFASPEVSDYYATTRPCGGSHTLTHPHKRITRMSHLSHLFREDDGAVYPIYKEEVDVQGADGHIYKGRMGNKLEAKLPGIVTQQTQEITMITSQQQQRSRTQRPASARVVQSPRPTSARVSSRPHSARQGGSGHGTPGPESSHTTPIPPESPPPEIIQDHPVQIEVPTTGDN